MNVYKKVYEEVTKITTSYLSHKIEIVEAMEKIIEVTDNRDLLERIKLDE